MLLAVEPLTAFGGIALALGSLAGGYAAIRARGIEARSASRADTEQAFSLLHKMLDEAKEDNDRLRTRCDQHHARLNELAVQLGTVTIQHQECEKRLVVAEARIEHLEEHGNGR